MVWSYRRREHYEVIYSQSKMVYNSHHYDDFYQATLRYHDEPKKHTRKESKVDIPPLSEKDNIREMREPL